MGIPFSWPALSSLRLFLVCYFFGGKTFITAFRSNRFARAITIARRVGGAVIVYFCPCRPLLSERIGGIMGTGSSIPFVFLHFCVSIGHQRLELRWNRSFFPFLFLSLERRFREEYAPRSHFSYKLPPLFIYPSLLFLPIFGVMVVGDDIGMAKWRCGLASAWVCMVSSHGNEWAIMVGVWAL